jgi:hypothetical protein
MNPGSKRSKAGRGSRLHVNFATESEEGKNLTGGYTTAAPPNRLAAVTAKNGFAWSRKKGTA